MRSSQPDTSQPVAWQTSLYNSAAHYTYKFFSYFLTQPTPAPRFASIPEIKSDPLWGQTAEFLQKNASTAVGRIILEKAAPLALANPEGIAAWHFGPNNQGALTKMAILITQPKHLEYFLKEHHDDIEDKDGTSLFAMIDDEGLNGKGNIFSLGVDTPEWRKERAIYSQAMLSRSELRRDVPKIQVIADDFIQRIKESKDQTIDLIEFTKFFTLETIGKTKLGLQSIPTASLKKISTSINDVAPILSNPLSRNFLFHYFPFKYLVEQSLESKPIIERGRSILADELLTPNENHIKESDNLLTHDLSDTERKSLNVTKPKFKKNAGFALVVGHETTANLFLYTLLLLTDSHHKTALDTLRHALSSIKKPVAEWTLEDIESVPYLTACIFETLRLYPPVPLQVTVIKNKIPFTDGFLNPGDLVFTSQLLTQRLESVWGKDALQFKPERFLNPQGQLLVDKEEGLLNHGPYEFFPFGFGNRKCPGRKLSIKEVQIMVARLVTQFDLQLKDELHHPFPTEVVVTLKSIYEKIELRCLERKAMEEKPLTSPRPK